MISENHPFHFVQSLFQRDDASFSFSKYVYTPDSLFDERELISLCGEELTEDRINREIESLRPDQELAMHSNMRIKGRSFHIPMIDFSTEESFSGEVFDRMSRYLPKKIMLNMAVYASGRSFHAYSTTLLSPKEWFDFIGRLLLVNPCNRPDIVDSRWIGHRLIGGFGSLRWSNNSGQYLGMPSRIAFPCEPSSSA